MAVRIQQFPDWRSIKSKSNFGAEVDSAAEKIPDQCEKALKECNTIICIADTYGWDVVEE